MTIFHNPQLNEGAQKSSEKSSQKILVLIRQNSGVTIDELAVSLQLTDRAIKKEWEKIMGQEESFNKA